MRAEILSFEKNETNCRRFDKGSLPKSPQSLLSCFPPYHDHWMQHETGVVIRSSSDRRRMEGFTFVAMSRVR